MRIAIHLSRWVDLNAFGSAFVECAFSVNAINAHPRASVNTPIGSKAIHNLFKALALMSDPPGSLARNLQIPSFGEAKDLIEIFSNGSELLWLLGRFIIYIVQAKQHVTAFSEKWARESILAG